MGPARPEALTQEGLWRGDGKRRAARLRRGSCLALERSRLPRTLPAERGPETAGERSQAGRKRSRGRGQEEEPKSQGRGGEEIRETGAEPTEEEEPEAGGGACAEEQAGAAREPGFRGRAWHCLSGVARAWARGNAEEGWTAAQELDLSCKARPLGSRSEDRG